MYLFICGSFLQSSIVYLQLTTLIAACVGPLFTRSLAGTLPVLLYFIAHSLIRSTVVAMALPLIRCLAGRYSLL